MQDLKRVDVADIKIAFAKELVRSGGRRSEKRPAMREWARTKTHPRTLPRK
jgi:hypothetical protein